MPDKKNILLLIADDLGRDVTSCYGSRVAQTPNLDGLAASGTRFDLAFASTASCSGSRSTIYTGLHTHNNGSYGLTHERNGFQTHADVETAPSIFNDLGYRTGILGKIHVAPVSQYPWQVRGEDGTRDVAVIADRAGQFFSETGDQPFFLTVGFVDPHRDIPHRGGFGNTADGQESKFDARIQDRIFAASDVEIPVWANDLPEVRRELAEYYRAVWRMDQGVGMILTELEKAGMGDDTMVVFMSDNGPPFINSKTTLYDAGVRLPFVVRVPGKASGVVNHHMVSWLDVLPSFLHWAGHQGRQPAPGMVGPRKGRSFVDIVDDGSVPGEDSPSLSQWSHVFGSHTFHEVTNFWPTRYMRDRRYKYHRNVCWRLEFPFAMDLYASLSWEGVRNSGSPESPVKVGQRSLKDYIFRPAEELYDLSDDPAEVRNLAGDPAHKGKLEEMRSALEKWQNDTKDLWLWRDGTSVWRYRMWGYHRDGLRIPDRFDFDVENPGNRDPHMAAVELDSDKVESSSYAL